jgi:hypothetical protein
MGIRASTIHDSSIRRILKHITKNSKCTLVSEITILPYVEIIAASVYVIYDIVEIVVGCAYCGCWPESNSHSLYVSCMSD